MSPRVVFWNGRVARLDLVELKGWHAEFDLKALQPLLVYSTLWSTRSMYDIGTTENDACISNVATR